MTRVALAQSSDLGALTADLGPRVAAHALTTAAVTAGVTLGEAWSYQVGRLTHLVVRGLTLPTTGALSVTLSTPAWARPSATVKARLLDSSSNASVAERPCVVTDTGGLYVYSGTAGTYQAHITYLAT